MLIRRDLFFLEYPDGSHKYVRNELNLYFSVFDNTK